METIEDPAEQSHLTSASQFKVPSIVSQYAFQQLVKQQSKEATFSPKRENIEKSESNLGDQSKRNLKSNFSLFS